jgi:hypothetical protein
LNGPEGTVAEGGVASTLEAVVGAWEFEVADHVRDASSPPATTRADASSAPPRLRLMIGWGGAVAARRAG